MPNLRTKDRHTSSKRSRIGSIWRGLVSGFSQWRAGLTREKLFDAFKSFLWIAPLTVMIWIYAEREQTVPDFTVSDVPVEITSKDMFVEPVVPGTPKVTLVLTGPQSVLEQVKDRLVNAIPRGLTIDVGNSFNPGDNQQINVVNRIENLAIFKYSGVSVVDSRPAEILINVDKFAHREVQVQSPPDVTNLNEATTNYYPRKVTVKGPATLLHSLAERGLLAVYPDLSGNEILKSPGTHELAVPIRLPRLMTKADRDRLTITPALIKATLDVRPADITVSIPSLPIWIECPPGLMDSYKVVFSNGEPTIANISVTGPKAQIDLLDSAQKWAGLVVTGGDTVGSSISRTLDYHLPPGVSVTPNDLKREVTFQLKKREGAE